MGFLNFNCLGYTSLSRSKRKQLQSDGEDRVRIAAAVAKANNMDHDQEELSGGSAIRKFSWDEIERFTMNLCSSRVIGWGGFSTVYLADLQGHLAAIKINNGSPTLFKQELDILRHLHHPNIVNLIGYCDDQGALAFEYVSNGNLQEKLHGNEQIVIPWKKRMAIALQLAQALEYLHDKCGSGLPIVHGDIKASNVLLDHHLNARLCDFGSAKMGFSSAVVMMRNNRPRVLMGSPGYTDPQYLRTGIPSKKNDIYSFGVLLLELVTCLEAFSSERPAQAQLLTSMLGPMLDVDDDNNCTRMVDPRLGPDFDQDEAKAMLSLSAQCLRHPSTLRPSAAQILETINNHISSITLHNLFFSPDQDQCKKPGI